LEGTETGEGIIECFFVDEEVEAADEELGANFDGFLFIC
jgi:hypothetical protein